MGTVSGSMKANLSSTEGVCCQDRRRRSSLVEGDSGVGMRVVRGREDPVYYMRWKGGQQHVNGMRIINGTNMIVSFFWSLARWR